MQSAGSLVADQASQLSNNKIITRFNLKEDRLLKATAGEPGTAVLMRSNSQSAWMIIRAICRSADGTWSSWYVTFDVFTFWKQYTNLTLRAESVSASCQPILIGL